ncbi:hypothetical protein [Runella sp.]|uniref:hypothetical protein n=1 Tax=Runella sp. TaxID=1960881 RepID=UPI003D10D04D
MTLLFGRHFLRNCVFVWVCLCLTDTAAAQYEKYLHKDYKQRAALFGNFWEVKTTNDNYDSTLFFNEVLGLRQAAAEHDDAGLEMDTYMMELSFFLYRKKYANNLVVGKLELDKALHFAHDKKLLNEASVEKHFGQFYFRKVKNYELAFEHYLNMYEIIRDKSLEEFPDKINCINQLIYAYYEFADYEKAIHFAKIALHYEQKYQLTSVFFRNYAFIGNCFRDLNQPDSAMFYYQKALDNALSEKDTYAVELAKGCLGYILYRKNDVKNAIPLLKAGIEATNTFPASDKYKHLFSRSQLEEHAMLCRIGLSDIEAASGQLSKAEALAAQAVFYQRQSGEWTLKEKLFPHLSKLYIRNGNKALALMYFDSTMMVRDSLSRQFNTRKMLRAHQKAELAERNAELETQKKIKKTERNALIGLLAMLFLASLYIYFTQRHRFMRKQRRWKEKEVEMQTATEQLQEFIQNAKNRWAEDAENVLLNTSSHQAMRQLQQAVITTDAEWERFRRLFDQVHPGYLQRMKDKLSPLTPAEIRFLALVRLGLSTKEMTFVLGISSQSVRTIWYRLRKKLNFPEDSTPEQLAESI